MQKGNECGTGNHLKIGKVRYRKCLWNVAFFQKADMVAFAASVIKSFDN